MKQTGIIYICVMVSLVLLLGGCKKELKPAEVIVIDPVRHYYPVVQGEILEINYEFENVSANPLFIQEVQTSCGCLVPKENLPIVILPHKRGFLNMKYNSIMNNGYVEHYIDCYGNFKDSTMVTLVFDTNVVPKADYFRDYEQLWKEQAKDDKNIRELVDGNTSDKGYYTGEGEDLRSRTNRDVQGAINRALP